MRRFTIPLVILSVATLGACTDPAYVTGDQEARDEYRNTKGGAIIGGLVGAGVGKATGGNVLAGAAIGAGVGAIIGHDLDQQAQEIRDDVGNNGVTVENAGDRLIVTLPQDLVFESDSYVVRPDLVNDIGAVADSLKKYPDSVVQVIGHTDSSGSAEHNQTLSERRANAVADKLMDAGIAFERIETVGKGENEPVASNLNEEGKAKNRRVEIVILPNA
ncbi:Outer membrane protein OmpA [Shimia gijangensis]|uniref:Outer membrane protein OmpA n=1 Tax=Shimia gijangensis TaxID=1470563 RepID=A0A1M6B0D1_9RHOB|nr:OmpA family protein [Shimia gijangensis]SHI42028.1 Outer membrane protein OmpA [Shimia gijangensis]